MCSQEFCRANFSQYYVLKAGFSPFNRVTIYFIIYSSNHGAFRSSVEANNNDDETTAIDQEHGNQTRP